MNSQSGAGSVQAQLESLRSSLTGLQERVEVGARVCLDLVGEIDIPDKKERHLNQLTATTAQLAEADLEIEMMKQALNFIITDSVSAMKEGNKNIDLVRIFQNKLDELTNSLHPDSHRFIDNFRAYAGVAADTEAGEENGMEMEGDILLAQVRVSTTCPLTQQQLKSPMKNPRCGHLYSRQAILQHIKTKKASAQCPVSGCDAVVVSGELSTDPEMEARLRRENRARKSRGKENCMVYKKKQ